MPDILIADDHSAVRLGVEIFALEAVPGCKIDFAADGNEVLELLAHKQYDILITDLLMPGNMGVSLVAEALSLQTNLKVIVISAGAEEDFALQCFQAGAFGFLNKGVSDTWFIEVIRAVSEGRRYISEETKEKLMLTFVEGKKELKLFKILSQREMEVAMLLLKGYGVLEIANELAISPSTASTLKGRVFHKFEITSVVELGRIAYQNGVIPDRVT